MALPDDQAALARDGYVILRDVLPPDALARMRARIDEASVDACLGLTALFAIDPFRADNGATLTVPGTHRLDVPAGRPVAVELPAGACLVFDLRLLHGGGANTSGELRRAVFAMYVRSWVKPMVDGPRSTPPDVALRASPKPSAASSASNASPSTSSPMAAGRSSPPQGPPRSTASPRDTASTADFPLRP